MFPLAQSIAQEAINFVAVRRSRASHDMPRTKNAHLETHCNFYVFFIL